MNEISFTWDAEKNRTNQRKHKISFEEASTSFSDANARLKQDSKHSEDEDRLSGYINHFEKNNSPTVPEEKTTLRPPLWDPLF